MTRPISAMPIHGYVPEYDEVIDPEYDQDYDETASEQDDYSGNEDPATIISRHKKYPSMHSMYSIFEQEEDDMSVFLWVF